MTVERRTIFSAIIPHFSPRILFLGLFSFLFLTACATEYNLATNKEEALMYGTDKEVQIGESFARSIEKYYENKIVTDIDINERVEKILKKIVAVSDRSDLVYFIKVIDEDTMNAVSLPGRYIYVFKGLIDKIKSDDQLAGVIAHEVGHINAKHSLKRIQASYGAMLIQVAAATTKARNVSGGLNFALTSLFMENSQQDEFEADALGVKYMKAAGYNPQEMIKVLEKLRAEQEKAPIRAYTYWRTHPHLTERIAAVNTVISGKMEFRDYIRMIDR